MRSNGRSTSGGGVNGGLSVRQLLELERQLYQESIERVQAQQAALRLGSLEDFVLRCLPFEAERERELERAVVQLQLSQRNGLDLLQFELQAADDVFRDERRRLKRRLIAQTERRLRRIEARRSELQVAQASGPTPFRPEFVQEIKAQREEEQRRRQRVEMPSEVDGETLEQELEQVQRGTRKAFNFLHMQHAVPAPTRIVEDVAHALLDFSDRVAAVDAEPTDDNAPMARHVRVSRDGSQLVYDSATEGEMTKFRVEDAVVLTSHLTDEEFYGQVAAIEQDKVELELVCGTRVHVAIERLQTGRCSLRYQSTFSTSASPSVRRRTAQEQSRRRRKSTIDIRRGF